VGEGAEQELRALGAFTAGAERVTRAALLPAVAALDLPALAVALAIDAPLEAPARAAPARGPDASVAGAPRVDRNQGISPERRTEGVVPLGVVPGVGEHARERHGERRQARGRAPYDGAEERTVVARPLGGHGGEDEVRLDIAAHGELGPAAGGVGAAAVAVVRAAVRQLVARAVDGDRDPLRAGRGRVEQARGVGEDEGGVLEGAEGPPFSSRRAA